MNKQAAKELQVKELKWNIEGRRFHSREEYEAAIRDKLIIDSITCRYDLSKPADIEALYMEMKNTRYRFESVVGRQFDDNIYELYLRVKNDEEEKKAQQELKKEQKLQRRQRIKESLGKGHNTSSKPKEKIRLDDFDRDMQRKILMELRKNERKRKLVVIASVVLCIASLGSFTVYYRDNIRSSREFKELARLKEVNAMPAYSQNNGYKIHLTQKSEELPDVLPEYQTLLNKNKMLIGWIKIPDTPIDYPVMQTADNEYYLDHNFNQEKDKNGCIFMDFQCDAVNGNDNTILYGHHMKSGSMFGSLNRYSKKSYYDEHPVIQFDTVYEKGEYQIMYVFRSKVYSEEEVAFKYYQFIDAGSEQEFNSYINEMSRMSLYDTGITAVYGDRLLTLSTCDYQENKGRFVVVAKKI